MANNWEQWIKENPDRVVSEETQERTPLPDAPDLEVLPKAIIPDRKPDKVFRVTPMGKPRMTQRDKWNPSGAAERYWKFKDAVRAQMGDFKLPEAGYHLVCYVPCPKTYPERAGKPHHLTPDKDNIEKGFLDALFDEDKHIWDGRVTVVWCPRGEERIEVYVGELPSE